MKRQHTLAAVAAMVLALSLTSCGADEETPSVASGSGAQPTSSASSAAPSLSKDEMGVKYAGCMRENGVNVPDPEPGKPAQFKFDASSGVTKADIDKAMEACKQYSPDGGAAANPQQEENGRKFAECMRKNGVESFPDPKPGQRGIMIDGETGKDPDLQKAQQACQPILAGQ
ncbi:MAG TPA: hypothetical protein VFG33_26650 [Kribbella sp.]|uniref:hypothetical protein n=1 Tax=Kribbella sp. TaxID=1871183 RepID=UPI002D773E05|nr:hypothetical protein [Kribbella sp.]HET6296994.1 hypothetical protein [Kribbella sp.]